MLPASVPSPPYCAVRLCEPSVNVETVSWARFVPPVRTIGEEPSSTPPSKNVTVPVGRADPETGLTTAVSTTAWFNADGLGLALNEVWVDAA